MKTASHVFIRRELLGRTLQPPYEGPYKVIKRSEKVFTFRRNGKDINVSIDLLKLMYILQGDDTETSQQKEQQIKWEQPEEIKTRSERTSRPSVRFQIP